MARKARIVIPNVAHHVTQRGNRRQTTFHTENDYETYIRIMSISCKAFGVKVFAYCLMPNHVHIVAVPETEDSLRLAIGDAHQRYTRYFNFKNKWTGCLWQGRFYLNPMDDDYMLKCIRYVEQNPIRAKLCKEPQDYVWSSAKAHINGINDQFIQTIPELTGVSDWKSFLSVQDEDKVIEEIRLKARTGAFLKKENTV